MLSQNLSIRIVLGIVGAVTLFHVAILLQVVPYDITWGGRLKSDQEMYVFETISILINGLFAFVLLIKGGFIKQYLPEKAINIVLGIFMVLFVLNTLGNIIAKSTFEKFFAIVTFALAVLIWMILRKRENT